ncbi:hypothetical protein FCULG_00012381 [Fusarium culmorum]|uniref:DUF6603 domain-containing protein n=1 Tax=Fusarium culmorum TaxID=5516 RepID=A0A2T4GRH1_FUSCU|nr:hypothetical protein FCULG_00012381 [Fusarium culmorum]
MTIPSHSSSRQKATIDATATDDATYGIYASSANKDPGDNIRVLSAGSSTDKFVESLNSDKVITLSSEPDPTAKFDASDPTLQWLKIIDDDAAASLTLGEEDIESFEFKFSDPWSLVFSSASDVLLFTFGSSALLSGDASGSRIEPPGIDAAGSTLTCGLDFTQMEDIEDVRVKDVFKNASQGDITQYIATAVLILPVFLRTPDEKAPPRRNALWFIPSDAMRVETRLQFQLPQFKALQDLFSPSLGGLMIDSADLVHKSKEEGGVKVFPNATLRRLHITLDTTQDKEDPKLDSFSFDVEVTANFGKSQDGKSPIFLITYMWDRASGTVGTLAGDLWNTFEDFDDWDLTSSGEHWNILTPVTPSPATSVNIATLIPGRTVYNIPDTLPSDITVASIELSQESFALKCVAAAIPPSPGSAPQPYLGELGIATSFTWGKSSTFTLDAAIAVVIDPSEGSDVDTSATFIGSLSYDSSDQSWVLRAAIESLYAAVIAEFFVDDAKGHVGPLISSIAISSLSIEYSYEKPTNTASTTVGSRFAMSGDLVIAGLRLNLDFTHEPSGFEFSAALNPEDKEAQIGDILADILGVEFDIPDFVHNTLLVAENKDTFRIDIQKKTTTYGKADIESFQFLAQLRIGLLQILFSQIHSTKWGPRDPSKRLFKAAINGFGEMELVIPLVGYLTQPLDELYFLFVQDPKPPRAPGQLTGLTRDDVALFNSGLKDEELLVADKIKPDRATAADMLVPNVGLKYKDKTLSIVFDATFQLGPIGFTLLDFTVNSHFVTMDQLPGISIGINGLAASFDRSPMAIAGIIVHGNDGDMDYYAGGLIVGFRPWQFQAAGFYGVVLLKDNKGEFQSVFVFAKLNGPLMTLAFAEISGICGGFGYNSSVRLPAIDQVSDFPFINSGRLSGNGNAQEVLVDLIDPSAGGWFAPLDMVAVQFGNSFKLGIFAVATCDIPSARSRLKLAHAELGIAAVLDFDYGFFKIEAQLSPRSYILSPNCQLTGGFALCYWFDAPLADKARVGDFVFTLGGYHQAFRVPIGYPNPPRLGISWNLGGGLSISGEAYFAITTKSCMAGGRLHAAFKAGPLSAWFDAFANFLINYRPFHFDMSARVSVGVGFSISFWFIHIRISVQIGAQLFLWGPPVAGRVHVDFWIVAFDINFGDHITTEERIGLADFYDLVLQETPASSFASAQALITGQSMKQLTTPISATSTKRPRNEAHNFLAESGLLNSDDTPERGQDGPWTVRAGSFVFVAECKMAITATDAPDFVHDFSLEYQGHAGNNVNDLLNTADNSAPLMTGVRVIAPKPTVSPDPFPAYNVADADLQELTAEKSLPTMMTVDSAWAPVKPNEDVKKRYEDVHQAWMNPVVGESGQQGFVGTLAQSLGWGDVSGLKNIAGIPDRLKKGFMNMYVASPLLTV